MRLAWAALLSVACAGEGTSAAAAPGGALEVVITTAAGAPVACAAQVSYETGPVEGRCTLHPLTFELADRSSSFELAEGGAFAAWNAQTGLSVAGQCAPASDASGVLSCLDAAGACVVTARYELHDCD